MRLFGVLLTIMAVVMACGDDDGAAGTAASVDDQPAGEAATPDEPSGAGAPYDVRTSTVTFTDASRSTPATAGAAERPERTLPTHLYEPDSEGPFPLIVFAHGLNGHPRKFTQLHTAWAEAGYVVAAPTFPVSNDEAPGGGGVTDLDEQPADLGFVLDQLLGPDSSLASAVDTERIGAGGLSLGGATVYAFAYDDCCRDERVTATMVLAGNQLGFAPDLTCGPPLLLVHADRDPALPYENSVMHYAEATVPATFVTLHETAHAEPYEDVDDPADDLVEQVTTAWWDRWLTEGAGDDRSADALDRIDTAVDEASDLATRESNLD